MVACFSLAGMAVAAAPAIAQDLADPLPYAGAVHVGFMDRTVNLPVNDALRGSCPNTAVAALGSGGTYILEDVDFNPGPWGSQYTGPRVINTIGHMFQTTGWTGTPIFPPTGTPTAIVDHVFEFYDPGSFSSTPMVGAPFAVRRATATVGSDFAWTMIYALQEPIDIGTRTSVWVATRAVISGTNLRIADAATGNQQPPGQTVVTCGPRFDNTVPCAGTTTNFYGRDTNGNDIFEGCFLPPPSTCDSRTLTGAGQSLQLIGYAKPIGFCDTIDFNNDGHFPDTSDVDALLSVFSGGACLSHALSGGRVPSTART